jgi:hypothetical protein
MGTPPIRTVGSTYVCKDIISKKIRFIEFDAGEYNIVSNVIFAMLRLALYSSTPVQKTVL